jgi:hypothetical protein
MPGMPGPVRRLRLRDRDYPTHEISAAAGATTKR